MYARYKLMEAEFFWAKARGVSLRTQEHVFYFSAFLSAFRSFTFVLQSQYKRCPGFEAQYEFVTEYLRSNVFFNGLKDARNIALKQGSKVPVLITRAANNATNDVISWECDPLPDTEDVIRNVSVEIGFRQEWLIPPETPDTKRTEVYFSQLYHVLQSFWAGEVEIEQLIRVEPNGAALPLGDLVELIDQGLSFFSEILPTFEALPSVKAASCASA